MQILVWLLDNTMYSTGELLKRPSWRTNAVSVLSDYLSSKMQIMGKHKYKHYDLSKYCKSLQHI